MSHALTLYVDRFWISPYAMTAFVGLEEKGLPYQLVDVGLDTKDHLKPGYLARTGRVPALRHGEFWLAESQAIAEYLAETFPFPKYPRLFPEDLQQRAVCREVMAWVRSDLMPIREERPTTSVFYGAAVKPLSKNGEAALQRLLKYCDAVIAEGRTTLFAQWCIADADLGLMLQRLNLAGQTLPKKVKAYADAQWQRPSVQKWVAHQRPPYVDY